MILHSKKHRRSRPTCRTSLRLASPIHLLLFHSGGSSAPKCQIKAFAPRSDEQMNDFNHLERQSVFHRQGFASRSFVHSFVRSLLTLVIFICHTCLNEKEESSSIRAETNRRRRRTGSDELLLHVYETFFLTPREN